MTAVQAGISTREAEVLALLGEHLSNAEIAARLFISVRTVETHVSSMLRKLDAPDRRALAQLAVEWGRAARGGDVTLGLPAPVTSFVGRAQERAALAAAVTTHRQVSAVGPGGVGKTRLALAVAGDVAPEFPDGVWFVDLVPITDAAMVGATVAAAVGVGEQQGRGIDDTVISALADRRALLVLDNCEQVRDGVAPFLERLLAAAPKLTVLATSRARLMVPFERVHPIPPMSLTGDDDSDAVALFLDRAAAVGWPVAAEQREQVAEICRGLDGVALAIELAAARLPMLGLDGLSGVLADQLRVLTGGARADDRHRSVRAMLDWSVALLDPADRTLLHRIAVFVAPFTVDAAAQVAGATMDGLARLTEQSLLSATPAPGGMRYRTLATIRQCGLEQLAASGELDGVRAEQLRWCLAIATGLAQDPKPGAGPWRARFDDVADDMRAVLGWAVTAADHRGDAYALAVALANLAFTRNLIGEAQLRYEQAAALTGDPYAAGAALRQAAAVAGCRMRGDDMYRLYYAAAETARSAGDDAGTARDLATAAATVYRFSGTFAELPPAGEAAALLAEAQELAGDDPAASAAVALAECGVLSDTAEADLSEAVKRAERAVDLARTSGDPLAHSAALDALAAVQCWAGDTFATAASSRQRVDLLAKVPAAPAAALERTNALSEAAESSVGVGDLAAARRWGEQLRDLPLLAERGDFATSRLLLADALAGNAEGVLAACGRFRDAWGLSGGLHTPTLATAAAAVAMIHGLRGDETARAEWLGIVDELDVAPELKAGYSRVFDALVLLHEGRAGEAFALLATEPDEMSEWAIWVWRHWYLAVRAEAAALSGQPDARDQIAAARPIVAGNPIASAHLDRAEALLDNDSSRVLAAAAAFEAAGSRYQRARTLVLAGGDHAKQGGAALTDLGLTPGTP